jgi:hypothetical protein
MQTCRNSTESSPNVASHANLRRRMEAEKPIYCQILFSPLQLKTNRGIIARRTIGQCGAEARDAKWQRECGDGKREEIYRRLDYFSACERFLCKVKPPHHSGKERRAGATRHPSVNQQRLLHRFIVQKEKQKFRCKPRIAFLLCNSRHWSCVPKCALQRPSK